MNNISNKVYGIGKINKFYIQTADRRANSKKKK